MQIKGFTAEHHFNNSHVFQMDNMDFMRQIPDKYFDLGVVDPPYGIGAGKFGNGRRKGKKLTYSNKKNWDNSRPDNEYFKQLFRITKNQVIWGANYFTEALPPSSGWIFWDKMQPEEVSFASGELAYTSFNKALKKIQIRQTGALGQVNYESRIHITQKPIALYSWIFDNYAKPGWRILDTHLGSQSSRIAAYKKGFEFWATELDPDYFSEGNARFINAVKMPLFENLPPEQLQMW